MDDKRSILELANEEAKQRSTQDPLMTKNIFNNPILDVLRALDDSPVMRVIRAIEDSPEITRIIRNINNSPALRIVHEFENSPTIQMLRKLEKSPAMLIMRDIGNSPALKTIKKLENLPIFKTIHKLQDFPALCAIRALEDSSAIKAFSKVADQLNHNYGMLTFLEASDLLVNEYAELSAIEQEDIQDRISRTPSSPLTAEFYLNLTVVLFVSLLSQMSAIETEERVIERINNFEKIRTAQFNVMQNDKFEHVFLVTDRALNFRNGPSLDHDVIDVIPKNKKVMKLERDRDWIKIEYFDYINNEIKVGWAHSRYLLIVDSEYEY